VGAETMCSGREFQIWAAATGKARLPTVESLTGGNQRSCKRRLPTVDSSIYI